MASPESLGEPEPRVEIEVDQTPVLVRLGHLGLVDASLYDHPNPTESPAYWKSIN